MTDIVLSTAFGIAEDNCCLTGCRLVPGRPLYHYTCAAVGHQLTWSIAAAGPVQLNCTATAASLVHSLLPRLPP
jgi:hypothetical protein